MANSIEEIVGTQNLHQDLPSLHPQHELYHLYRLDVH